MQSDEKRGHAPELYIKQTGDPPSGDGKLDSLIPQDKRIAARAMYRNIYG
jgi:hypothetical protein